MSKEKKNKKSSLKGEVNGTPKPAVRVSQVSGTSVNIPTITFESNPPWVGCNF